MTVERPFHPLDSQILEVASDKAHSVEESVVTLEDEVRSRTVEILDCYQLQNIMWISLCIESTSNVENPCFSGPFKLLHLDFPLMLFLPHQMDSGSPLLLTKH